MQDHWYFLRLGFLDLNPAGWKLLPLPSVNKINQPTDSSPSGHFVGIFYVLFIKSCIESIALWHIVELLYVFTGYELSSLHVRSF